MVKMVKIVFVFFGLIGIDQTAPAAALGNAGQFEVDGFGLGIKDK